MAKVWLTEYQYAGRDGATNSIAMPLEPSTKVQVIDITGGAQVSAVLQATTAYVLLTSDGPFCYKVGAPGATPAADPTVCTRIASGGISIAVSPGATTKIAVAQG